MQAAARRCTRTSMGLSPYPHLSLAYGEPHPDNDRLAAVLSEEFSGREIVFDRLALCRSSKNIAINDWQRVAHYALGRP